MLLIIFILYRLQALTKQVRRMVVVIIIVIIGMLMLSVKEYNRYTQVEQAVSAEIHTQSSPGVEEQNSTTVRMHLWPEAWQVILQHPFIGVGVGDVKDELVDVYKKNNYQIGVEKQFNPHNQYLQTMVTLGFIGLVSLSFILFYPMYISIKSGQFLFLIFMVIVALNIVTESMLERQAGILFFCFFSMFFYTQFLNQKERMVSGE